MPTFQPLIYDNGEIRQLVRSITERIADGVIIVNQTNGEGTTINLGEATFVDFISGDLLRAKADSIVTSKVAFLNAESVASGTVGLFQSSGVISLSSITKGVIYYLSPTVAGGITSIRPTTAGHFIVPIGIGLASNRLLIAIQPPIPVVIPSTRVTNNAAIAIVTSTVTTPTFNTERWDTNETHDTTTNPSRLTCQTAGLYLIIANIEFDANATGHRMIRLRLNATTNIARTETPAVATAATTTNIIVSTIYNLAVSDFIEVQVFQTSGGNLNINTTTYSPDLMMTRLN